jgi:hypothetical protein
MDQAASPAATGSGPAPVITCTTRGKGFAQIGRFSTTLRNPFPSRNRQGCAPLFLTSAIQARFRLWICITMHRQRAIGLKSSMASRSFSFVLPSPVPGQVMFERGRICCPSLTQKKARPPKNPMRGSQLPQDARGMTQSTSNPDDTLSGYEQGF